MNLKNARYIFPNLFTLGNIFAGLYSIKLSLTARSVEELTMAAWLVVVSMLCDLADGRVARMTDAESEFGTQMDSLTDGISFGVAPAMLLYSWGLEPLGPVGVFVAFIFTCGAIMRLARFNVMAKQTGGASKYFLGLPTPLAAGTVVSVVLAHAAVTGNFGTGAYWNVAALAVMLGGLMVSNVRYRTFKDVDFRGRAMAVLFGLVGLAGLVGVLVKPSFAFVVGMVCYIAFGLVGGVVRWSRSFFGEDADESSEDLLIDATDEDH